MIPTSIDGTDITGATIDGTDVTEITVDGQTVFIPESNPVAYSDLIAWYPFDSSFYGGSNSDDATALFNPGQSGDSTAYDGTVSGATYQSSGGVTDINAGASSGGFDFDGSNDAIDLDSTGLGSVITAFTSATTMAWAKVQTSTAEQTVFDFDFFRWSLGFKLDGSSGWSFRGDHPDQSETNIDSTDTTLNSYVHLCATWDGSDAEFYFDGVSQGTGTFTSFIGPNNITLGNTGGSTRFFDGEIDDFRIYNTDLTSTQINDIIDNTQP